MADPIRAIYLMNMNLYRAVDGPFATLDEIPPRILELVDEDPDYELKVDRGDYVDLDIREDPWWRKVDYDS